MESQKQIQVGRVIQKEVSEIFHERKYMNFGKALVTIMQVWVAKDLSIARLYLSIYNAENPQDILKAIAKHSREIRRELAGRIRYQVRKIPELEFYLDDTMDQASRLEEIFKQIKDSSGKK